MQETPDIVTPGQWRRRELYTAISAALAAGSPAIGHAQAGADESAGALEEIIVSARKRDENIQDIPQAIQSFTQADISKSGIKGLGDVAKFVPAMTVVGSTPGFSKIVFRGLADSVRPYIADSSAAIYLDEQPLTTGAQSPEIRPIDLERIESLAGPQGTLYGASSQSGTVRYIVAKPDPGAFAANIGGEGNGVSAGGTGWNVDAMVNIPLIQDKLALRLVGFAAEDAGFIDNVLGTTPGHIVDDDGVPPVSGTQVVGSKTNAAIVKEDINSADWIGGRASLKWQVNDQWGLTGIYNYSDSTINGFNDYDPTTGDLKTVKFHEESWDDEWSNFQFSIDGDLGFAQLTSSTSYFERDTAYVIDGTSGVAYYHSQLGFYGRGTCGSVPAYAYYNIYDFATACELNATGYDVDDGDPTGFFRNDQKDKRWTHETRLTGSSSRWDWTLGFFYQKADQNWVYGTHIDDYAITESFAAYNAIYGPLPPTEVRWSTGETNERKDVSVFGEATIQLSDEWKLLLGARWYDTDIDRVYTREIPQGSPTVVVTQTGGDTGVLPKVGIQYFFDDDRMAYGLYSEGFRTGGINRGRGTPTLPLQYKSDLLQNYEAGLKARWMGGRLQTNIIGYHQVWKDMQLELVDPSYYCCDEVYQTFIANVGDAVVDGMDVELTFVPADNWSLGLVTTYLFKAEIDKTISVFDDRDPDEVALFIPGGTQLPLSSDINVSAYAEYDWPVDWLSGSEAYVRVQYAHTGTSFSRLVDGDDDATGTGYGGRAKQPSYQTWDLRVGLNSNDWDFSVYVDNIADERIVVYHDTNADLFWGRDNLRTARPRNFGVSLRRHFK